jgi:O-antigen ligase
MIYVLSFLNRLGLPVANFSSYVQSLLYVENRIAIGPTSSMNAFVSQFYYMYVDGGVMGVVIGMMIYGIVSHNLYKKAKNLTSARGMALYFLIVETIVTSMVRFQFTNIAFAMSVFYILLVKNVDLRADVETPVMRDGKK